MEEVVQVNKTSSINYSAIFEISNSEGIKILEKMLEWDIKFSNGILSGRNLTEKDKFEVSPCAVARAQGILNTAQKYLNIIQRARIKTN